MMHGNSITPIVVMVNHHLLNNPNQVLVCWFSDTIPLGIVVSQIIQDEFFLEIISSYSYRLETWWIIKHYQRHYTKPRNVVLRTRLSYCFLLSIKHGMHWLEELGLVMHNFWGGKTYLPDPLGGNGPNWKRWDNHMTSAEF